MSSKEIVKLLRRCMFSDTLLKMAADKIEELESEITRQQAEIERLNALVKTKNKLIEGLDQSISYAYDRAIKDFAERLKNEIINDTAYACDSTQHSGYYDYQIKIGDIPEYIDNLVKEMVGEGNGQSN